MVKWRRCWNVIDGYPFKHSLSPSCGWFLYQWWCDFPCIVSRHDAWYNCNPVRLWHIQILTGKIKDRSINQSINQSVNQSINQYDNDDEVNKPMLRHDDDVDVDDDNDDDDDDDHDDDDDEQ